MGISLRIAAVTLLVCALGRGEPLEYVDLGVRQYLGAPRIPVMENYKATQAVGLKFGLRVLDPVYWRNEVLARTDGVQFRTVMWRFQVGVEVTDRVAVEYGHYSEHLLDARGNTGFPNSDSIGIRWRVYGE